MNTDSFCFTIKRTVGGLAMILPLKLPNIKQCFSKVTYKEKKKHLEKEFGDFL
jgi:hypothetical protein